MLEEIFIKSVHQYFNPIAKKFALQKKASNMHAVVSYENNKVCLDVYYDCRRSYEMGVYIKNKQIEAKDGRRNSYDLALILDLKAPHEAKALGGFQTSNPEFIPEAVKTLAYSTQTYATEALKGEKNIFRELADLEEINTQACAARQKLWYARRGAEKAWESKKYADLIKAFKPLENELTPAEKKKLQYAQKMVR